MSTDWMKKVDEARKKRESSSSSNTTTSSNTSSNTDWMKKVDRARQEKIAKETGKATLFGLDDDLNSLNETYSSLTSKYKLSSGYKSASDALTEYESSVSDSDTYTKKADTIQSNIQNYLDTNDVDDDTKSTLDEILSQISKQKSDIETLSTAKEEESNYYSQFDNEYEYDVASALQNKDNYSADELKQILADLEDEKPEQTLSEKIDETLSTGIIGRVGSWIGESLARQNSKLGQDAADQLEASYTEDETKAAEKAAKESEYNSYIDILNDLEVEKTNEEYKSQSDFDEYSQANDNVNSDGSSYVNSAYKYLNNIDGLKDLVDTESDSDTESFRSIVGSMLSATTSTISDIKNAVSGESDNNVGLLSATNDIFNVKKLKYVTDDEKKTFNYIYNKEGSDKAEEYLNSLNLDKRNASSEAESASTAATESPVVASGISIGSNLISGMGYLDNVVRRIDPNAETSQYSDAQIPAIITDAIRENVGEQLNQTELGSKNIPLINQKVGSTLYSAGMSMADMFAAMAVGSAFSAGEIASGANGINKVREIAKSSEPIVLTIMSSGAATRTLNDALERGLSENQAVALGTLSGIAEYASEKIGLDQLLSDPSNAVAYILKSAAAEGSEEVLSDVMNDISDIIVSGNQAEMQLAYREYISQGMTENEAFAQVIMDNAQRSGASFLGGFLSGLAMSGGGATVNATTNALSNEMNAVKTGKEIINDNQAQKIINASTDFDNTSDTYKYGQKANKYMTASNVIDETSGITGNIASRIATNREASNLAKTAANMSEESSKILTATNNTEYFKNVSSRADFNNRVLMHDTLKENGIDVDENTFNYEKSYVDNIISGNEDTYVAIPQSTEGTANTLGVQESNITTEPENAPQTATEQTTDTTDEKVEIQKPVVNVDNSSVKVIGIKSVENGNAVIALENGKTATSDEIEFPDYATQEIYTKAGDYDTDTARLLVKSYALGSTSADVDGFINAFDAYYQAALDGTPIDYFEKYIEPQYKGVLNKTIKSRIMELGAKQRQANIKSVKNTANKNSTFRIDSSAKSVSKSKQTEINGLKTIAKAAKVNIVVFSDENDVNGWYDSATNEIHININGDYTVFQTAAHELTHFIRVNNPDGYEALKEYLLKKYEKVEDGEATNILVRKQQEKAQNSKNHPRKLTYDQALEEVVANACQNMLQDTQAIQQLAKENKSLAKSIKTWIDNFVKAIKEAFTGTTKNSTEYKWLSSVVDDMTELQELWDNALTGAVRSETTQVKLTDNTSPTENEDIRYSELQDTYSPRELLASALDTVAQNKSETKALGQYKSKINEINDLDTRLGEIGSQLKDLYFAKGTKDIEQIRSLETERDSIRKKINLADKKLLDLQATKPLKDLYNRQLKASVKEEYKKGKQELKEYKKERAATADKRKYIAGIESTAKELSDWIVNPKLGKSVPKQMEELVIDFINSIDYERGNLNKYGETTAHDKQWQYNALLLANKMTNPSQDFDFEFPKALLENFKEFLSVPEVKNARVIYDLDTDSLKILYTVMKTLKKTISSVNKFIAGNQKMTVSQATKEDIKSWETVSKRKGGDIYTKLNNTFYWNAMNSFTYFNTLGGNAEKLVFQQIVDGQNKMYSLCKEAQEYLDSITKDIDTSEWSGKNAKTVEFKLMDGNIKMTPAQLMALYETSKRKSGLEHILGKGIIANSRDIEQLRELRTNKEARKEFYSGKYGVVRVTESELRTMLDNLTDEQKQVADKLQKFLVNNCAAWGNEVTQKEGGYDGYTEEDYFMTNVDKDFVDTNDNSMENVSFYAIKNQSFTKSLVKGANNPIVISDVFDMWGTHVSGMAAYNGMSLPLRDAMRWLNYRETINGKEISTKDAMSKSFGKSAENYFKTLIADINKASPTAHSTEMSRWLVSSAKSAAVILNGSVAIQQACSYFRASAVIDPKYLVVNPINIVKSVELSKQYCPISWWKSEGHYETDIGRSMVDVILNRKTTLEKIKDAGMFLAQKSDEVAWGALWESCEKEISDTTDLEKGSEEYYKAVGKRLSDIINQTQVVDTVLHRSQTMRSEDTGLRGTILTFVSEPSANYNMYLRALNSGSKLTFVRTTTAIVLSQVAAAAAASLIYALRDNDDKKKYLEKWQDAFVERALDNLNPFSAIPYLNIIVDRIFNPLLLGAGDTIIDKDSSLWKNTLARLQDTYDDTSLDQQFIISAVKTGTYFYKYMSNKDTYNNTELINSRYQIIYNASKVISQLTGVGISNVMRETVAVWNAFSDRNIGYTYRVSDKYESMRNAISSGDLVEYNRIYDRLIDDGYTDDKIQSGIKSALANNDERLSTAAEARYNGDIDTFDSIRDELIAEGFDKDTVYSAANTAYNAYVKEVEGETEETESSTKTQSKYSYDDLINSIDKGYTNNSSKIVKQMQSEGKEDSAIRSALTSEYKERYYELKYKAYVQGNESAKTQLSELKSALKKLDIGYENSTFKSWDKDYYEWKKENK